MLHIDTGADKERETTPVVNILQHDRYIMDKYLLLAISPKGYHCNASLINEHPVRAHKEVFGRQSYCYTTYRRYWVWDFGTFRVWVNSDAGICFEVNVGTSAEDALAMVKAYASAWEEAVKFKEKVCPN